jgi:hypothetical protein
MAKTMTPTVFTKYDGGPLRPELQVLEDFIAEVDGKDCVIPSGDNTFVDDGTIDAEDAVRAFNTAAAALDQQAAEIARLKQIIQDLHYTRCAPQSLSERLREGAGHNPEDIVAAERVMEEAADALDAKDAEIELMQAGRKLHDELADHLEHDLAQKDAEIAQLRIDCEAWRQTAKTFEAAGRLDAETVAQQSALIAQAEAALEEIEKVSPRS